MTAIMKKIIFRDKFGLTQAVLEGRKTMTRRIVPEKVLEQYYDYDDYCKAVAPGDIPCTREYEEAFFLRRSPYTPGEIVAVAQSLRDMGYDPRDTKHKSGAIWGLDHTPAWTNKMFVSASECIHQIRITNIKVERLQDISDEDCIREGIEEDSPYYWVPVNMSLPNWRKIVEGVSDMYPNGRDWKVYPHFWDSPRKAFAALIDKISGKGTFESNPWVYVYEFELVK